MFTWANPPRPDGTRATFSVAILTPPPGESLPGGLDKTTEESVVGVKARRTNWSQTPQERGLIAGLEFTRVRWSGTEATTGRKMHGFMYVTIIGKEAVQLSSQDVDPDHEPPLQLAEAAALTFQKQ